MCPHCGRDAPIVYRGPLAYCSACGKARVPLSAAGVNITGKPAKIGGTLASVAGWVVLALMVAIALILGAILQAIFPAAMVGWIVGGVIASIGAAAAFVLLMGGRFLQRTGARASLDARKSAVMALAEHQRGILRPDAVANGLGVTVTEADAFLTELSKLPDSGVVLEVDADGKIYYRVPAFAPEAPWPPLGGAPAPNAPADDPDEIRVRVARTEIAQPRVAAPAGPLDDDSLDAAEVRPGSTKRTQV